MTPDGATAAGYYAIDPIPVREEAVADPELMRVFIRTNQEIIGGRKPYVVGEFGFVGTAAVDRILAELAQTPSEPRTCR